MAMTLDQQKHRAVEFLKALEWPEAETLAAMVTDDFEFDPMGRLKQVPVLHGKADSFSRDVVMIFLPRLGIGAAIKRSMPALC